MPNLRKADKKIPIQVCVKKSTRKKIVAFLEAHKIHSRQTWIEELILKEIEREEA